MKRLSILCIALIYGQIQCMERSASSPKLNSLKLHKKSNSNGEKTKRSSVLFGSLRLKSQVLKEEFQTIVEKDFSDAGMQEMLRILCSTRSSVLIPLIDGSARFILRIGLNDEDLCQLLNYALKNFKTLRPDCETEFAYKRNPIKILNMKEIADGTFHEQMIDDIDLAYIERPLHVACRLGKLKMIELLLQYGADITVLNAQNESAADLLQTYGLSHVSSDELNHAGEIFERLKQPTPRHIKVTRK